MRKNNARSLLFRKRRGDCDTRALLEANTQVDRATAPATVER